MNFFNRTVFIRVLTAFLVLFSSVSFAEQYTCAYPGFLLTKDQGVREPQVILKITISGNTAIENTGDSVLSMTYAVLENNDTGIVLVSSFASKNSENKRNEVGLFAITIEKSTLNLTRGNVINGNDEGAIRHGKCVKS